MIGETQNVIRNDYVQARMRYIGLRRSYLQNDSVNNIDKMWANMTEIV